MLLLGGFSDAVLRRAGEWGDGALVNKGGE